MGQEQIILLSFAAFILSQRATCRNVCTPIHQRQTPLRVQKLFYHNLVGGEFAHQRVQTRLTNAFAART